MISPAASDRHIAAFAPEDLCGQGQVLALGTWDIRLTGEDLDDTRHFVVRLVRWLFASSAQGSPHRERRGVDLLAGLTRVNR